MVFGMFDRSDPVPQGDKPDKSVNNTSTSKTQDGEKTPTAPAAVSTPSSDAPPSPLKRRRATSGEHSDRTRELLERNNGFKGHPHRARWLKGIESSPMTTPTKATTTRSLPQNTDPRANNETLFKNMMAKDYAEASPMADTPRRNKKLLDPFTETSQVNPPAMTSLSADQKSEFEIMMNFMRREIGTMTARSSELAREAHKYEKLADKRFNDLTEANVAIYNKVNRVAQENQDLKSYIKKLQEENAQLRDVATGRTQLTKAQVRELVTSEVEQIGADYLKHTKAQGQRVEKQANDAAKKAAAAQKTANSAHNVANKKLSYAEVVVAEEKKRQARNPAKKAARQARREINKQEFLVLTSPQEDANMDCDGAQQRPDLVRIGDNIKANYGLTMKDFSLSTTRGNNVKVRFTGQKPAQAEDWVKKLGYSPINCDPWHFGVLSGIPSGVTPELLKKAVKEEHGVELPALPIKLGSRATGTHTYKIACSKSDDYDALRFVYVNYERFAMMPYKPLTKKQRAARRQARSERERTEKTTNSN